MEDGARVCKRSMVERKRKGGRTEKRMREGRREGREERRENMEKGRETGMEVVARC